MLLEFYLDLCRIRLSYIALIYVEVHFKMVRMSYDVIYVTSSIN